MKKINWSAIKTILFAYLAISKVVYWVTLAFESYENMWRVILQRFLQQDILIIATIVFLYLFEEKFVLKRKKLKGVLAHAILALGGYVAFCVILIVYALIADLRLPTPANVWLIVSQPFMLNLSIVYFVAFGAITAKEHFKEKEAHNYALDLQSKSIKLEMLKSLRDGGVLSQEEFDKQETKLSEA